MIKLKHKPLVYLCTPYSLHPEGLTIAADEASSLLGRLLKSGRRVFCPIAHCHRASELEDLPTMFDWWMDYDEGWIDKCDEILVAKMPTWKDSKGTTHEINYATKTGKLVKYLNPETLEITDVP